MLKLREAPSNIIAAPRADVAVTLIYLRGSKNHDQTARCPTIWDKRTERPFWEPETS